MAAVLNLPTLAQAHKPVAGPAVPVAGGAEGGDIPHLHQPPDDLVQRPLVGDVELLGVGRALLFGIAADRGAGAAADLGDAQPDDLFPDLLALAGGDNHAGV